MSRKRKKIKTDDLDLLPVMNLFSILIPFLLSVAVFQKMAIVEVNMPSRSIMNNAPNKPDDQSLSLTVAITGDGLELWARGGSLPKIYTKEMHTYRCKSDESSFRVDPAKFNEQTPVKCQSGDVASKYEIETIHLYGLEKTSAKDPGKIMKAVYNSNDSVIIDATANFIQQLDTLKAGDIVATLEEGSGRKADAEIINGFREDYLSGYDMLAKTLIGINNRFGDLPDAQNIIVLADDKIAFDKVINVMDVAREAGFFKIQLAKLGGS
ncbi:MAG: biopolymer transporter ExbD [Fibrobacterales bacterium]